MRIALLHPTYWPEVRRGAERLVHDLGVALAARGHEVSILTTARRGKRGIAEENGVRVVRGRRLPDLGLARRGFETRLETVPVTAVRLSRERYDVVHTFSLPDAWAAAAIGRAPFVLSLTGAVDERSLASRRGRARMLERVASRAAAVTALSEFAASVAERSTGIRAQVLPAGVFTADFAPASGSPDAGSAPVILCAAAAGDPRKRVDLLIETFARLRERRSDARLTLLAAEPGLALHDGVDHIAPADTQAVARAYARATVTVLPAVDEAFGLVLVESLAAGVPVVAARSGASPEIVDDDAIGRLFDPDDPDALLATLEAALALAERPETAAACRAAAQRFDWAAVLPAYEALYEQVAKGRRPAPTT